ncbi:MAG: endosialidase, partial [Lachnospiraceae bacterium]|nr:endosialidase [Lachnospiraceae bacterium]
FVYESVPGTAVHNLKASAENVEFSVEGYTDSQVTLELEPEMEYGVVIGSQDSGVIKTNLGGKLVLSVELDAGKLLDIKIDKK